MLTSVAGEEGGCMRLLHCRFNKITRSRVARGAAAALLLAVDDLDGGGREVERGRGRGEAGASGRGGGAEEDKRLAPDRRLHIEEAPNAEPVKGRREARARRGDTDNQ